MKILRLIPVSICMISLILLQSCGPKGDGCEDHEPVHSYYNISNADKSKIPFTGTDTLVYISNTGDTAILYGQGKRAFTDKVAKKLDPDPACATYDYNYFENIEFTYTGNHPDLNYIFIDFNAGVYSPVQTNADILISQVSYSTYLGVLNHPMSYADTVMIDSNLYWGKKLYEGYGENDFLPCLYNYQYGLLKITTPTRIWLKRI